MASTLHNQLEQDGMCSVYSAQPSETNCSISEALAQEISAVNELPDEIQSSLYSAPKSETNVTVSDGFRPCQAMNQFNLSVYSAPKSETNVTMREKFEECKDLQKAVYSYYSAPPSETNVTMPNQNYMSVSDYSTLASEANVSMADGFEPCHALQDMAFRLGSEYSAVGGNFFDNEAYVSQLQRELNIPDSKIIGLENSDRSFSRVVDSNECLVHLDKFQPIPADFEQHSAPPSMIKSVRSIESYLLHTESIHHDI